jgi:hypothetical protein
LIERFVPEVHEHEVTVFCRRAHLALDEVALVAREDLASHRDAATISRLAARSVRVA